MRLRSILTMLALLCVVVPATRSLAQAEIPKEVIEAVTLQPDQVTSIEKFINDRLSGLSNSDPLAIKKNRDELLRPFRNPQASVAFRKAFSDKIVPELRKLGGNEKDLIAVNAIRIAGEIATSDAASVLEERLADKRVAVRYAAVNGLERTLTAVANPRATPAITAQRVDELIGSLGKIVSDPAAGPEIVNAAARALMQSMTITRNGFTNTRSSAFRTLSEGISTLAQKGADGPMANVLLLAVQSSQKAVADNAPGMVLAGDSLKQSGGLGGQLLSWAYCQLKAGKLPPGSEARKTASLIVGISENVVILSTQKAGGDQAAPANLGKDLEQGNDKAFVANLAKVIGLLNAPPFNYPPDTFLKCK
jgi:hypothetical protein